MKESEALPLKGRQAHGMAGKRDKCTIVPACNDAVLNWLCISKTYPGPGTE